MKKKKAINYKKHQLTVIDEHGIQMGHSFSINVSHKGFNEDLWKKLGKILGEFSKEEVVFAIESSSEGSYLYL